MAKKTNEAKFRKIKSERLKKANRGKQAGKIKKRQEHKKAPQKIQARKEPKKSSPEIDLKKGKILTKGKERGFITYDEILKEFPNIEEDIL